MGGKGKKKGKGKKQQQNDDEEKEEGGNGNGGSKKGKKGKKGGGKKGSGKFQGDMFSESAMENAYYICHNVMDVLKARGFAWPEAQKKKKKGKK